MTNTGHENEGRARSPLDLQMSRLRAVAQMHSAYEQDIAFNMRNADPRSPQPSLRSAHAMVAMLEREELAIQEDLRQLQVKREELLRQILSPHKQLPAGLETTA